MQTPFENRLRVSWSKISLNQLDLRNLRLKIHVIIKLFKIFSGLFLTSEVYSLAKINVQILAQRSKSEFVRKSVHNRIGFYWQNSKNFNEMFDRKKKSSSMMKKHKQILSRDVG